MCIRDRDIRGDRVRLGINAPHSVSVHRKEIYEAIRHENIEASRADVVDLSELGDMLSKAGTAGEIGGEQIEKEGEIKRREQEKEDADENTQA